MSKESSGFFRKVVRFVANPTTEWSSLDTAEADSVESEYAKSEIKAMIERKRRNDFVRKREFDMLRKIRREGISGDAAAMALNAPSNLDLDSRPHARGAHSDLAVKAKIDAIERQMVGGGTRPLTDQVGAAPTTAVKSNEASPNSGVVNSTAQNARAESPSAGVIGGNLAGADPHLLDFEMAPSATSSASAPLLADFVPQQDFQVAELVHDPELDEAVIAFANADFDQCERCLLDLIKPEGSRHEQTDTWMALFDYYRAMDLAQQFDNLAVTFAQKFGVSAPQWYSLPSKVAKFLAEQKLAVAAKERENEEADTAEPDAETKEPAYGWVAGEHIDGDAVAQLRVEILQMPRPWIMDWSKVRNLSPEGADHLGHLLRQWAQENIEIHWTGAHNLIEVLADLAPTGSRSVDPAYWMLRLDVLRMCNDPIQFDEIAIDYCVTYELSPPSWEPTVCQVRLNTDDVSPRSRSLTHVSKVTTSFVESQFSNEVEFVQIASLNLSGQLIGDISSTLAQLDSQLGASISLDIDCQHLLRVDFIAAGDLLNWVLARRAEKRNVMFNNPHRLIALFFGAMGINEHAHIKLQTV